ncbi:hypothetical protein [Pseudomonas sp. NPDC089396]|uniref:hypothetical protein n=1 Tax=Pseudomonas sp. NPDC089396 TaxID=3364461 RepID=UPI003835C77B
MIPVDMPLMLLGYMIYLFSEVFLWLFAAGLIAMLFPSSRRYMLARRWKFGFLMMFLAAGSLPYVESTLRLWQDWRAHHPRLKEQQVVGDLVLPVGTKVHLQYLEPFDDLAGEPVPYGLQSLKHADFDRTPGTIKGLEVRRLELWDGSATVKTLAAHELEGWHCEPGQVVYEFPFGARFKHSQWRLDQCTLAPGTALGGITWPGPVRVIANGAGWVARSDETPVTVQGIELREFIMILDRPYGEGDSWEGYSNHPFDFGPVYYPANTQVSRYHGQLLFSLPLDAQAQDRRSGSPIEGGNTVVQTLEGKVLGVRPSRRAGDPYPDEIVVP